MTHREQLHCSYYCMKDTECKIFTLEENGCYSIFYDSNLREVSETANLDIVKAYASDTIIIESKRLKLESNIGSECLVERCLEMHKFVSLNQKK